MLGEELKKSMASRRVICGHKRSGPNWSTSRRTRGVGNPTSGRKPIESVAPLSGFLLNG